MALGDSFTEGLQDDLGPDGRHRGWADRVAAGLAGHHGPVRYANLAVRGRLLDQVIEEQVPVAVDRAPDLVTFHAGANDVLRPRLDMARLSARYRDAVAALRAAGSEVVLFTVMGRNGSGRIVDELGARFAAFNDHVRSTAVALGATVVELGVVPVLGDSRLWDEDRLHLAPAGHERVAAATLEALGISDPALVGGAPGWWRLPLPTPARIPRRRAVADEALWVRRHLLPWVGRRLRGVSSGDTVGPKHPSWVEVLAE